jgi:hypothetical protein
MRRRYCANVFSRALPSRSLPVRLQLLKPPAILDQIQAIFELTECPSSREESRKVESRRPEATTSIILCWPDARHTKQKKHASAPFYPLH